MVRSLVQGDIFISGAGIRTLASEINVLTIRPHHSLNILQKEIRSHFPTPPKSWHLHLTSRRDGPGE